MKINESDFSSEFLAFCVRFLFFSFIYMPVDVNISQPWMLSVSVCQFLARCQSPTGGFGGGPGQHSHLAPTYAAVNALCILGTEEAYKVINRFHVCFILSPVYLQMLCGSYCHSSTFCLPPPPSERSSWTSCTLWSSQMAPLWCMWAGRWTSGEFCHRAFTLKHLHNSHASFYSPCWDVTILRHSSGVTFYCCQQTD